MAANDVYINPGTPVTFKSAAGTVPFSPASVAAGAGRKSAEWDRGAGAQPGEYEWRAKTKLQATPVVGETIDIYLATSDGTIIDGGTTAGDATFTDEDALKNMHYIGSFVVDTVTTDSIQASGVFRMVARRGILIWWNATAIEALTADGSVHEFIATPIPAQVQ